MPNFSLAITFKVSPATTVVVFAVPLEQVAVGSARGLAAGATHLGFGILIASPGLIDLGLVICVLTNWIWSSVTLADFAIDARESPALTVWFAMILQFVPV